MTVIAWDGKMIAADKLSDWGRSKVLVTKLRVLGNDEVAGLAGNASRVMAMLQWYRDGADPVKFPYEANKEREGTLIIASASGVRSYSHTPYAEEPDKGPMAYGWGRDFALAAMACGRTASEAVRVTNQLCSKTGLGVDFVIPGMAMQSELA